MRKFLLLIPAVMALSAVPAQTCQIPLWPDGPAESNEITAAEERRDNWNVYNISEAALYLWPARGENTGMTILICPGGGYGMQAAGHEGKMFAEWFASRGITAAVLKYRLPNGHSEIPITDARQAMRIMRENADKWGINASKIGVIGFSAGGHLASTLLTRYDEGSRPDFGILFYPVITMTRKTHGGSRNNLLGKDPSPELIELYSNEKQVTADTPPTMIFFSDDDRAVDPRNGTMFYDALKANGVPAAFHIFPSGDHGWGFHDTFRYHEQMKSLTLDWLERVSEK